MSQLGASEPEGEILQDPGYDSLVLTYERRFVRTATTKRRHGGFRYRCRSGPRDKNHKPGCGM